MSSTRRLVDRELLPIVESLPALELTDASMPAMRAAQALAAEGVQQDAIDAPYAEVVRDVINVSTDSGPGARTIRLISYRSGTRASVLPVLLWFHGGGFVLGRAESDQNFLRRIASETGALVLSVEYRLAPQPDQTALIDDAYASLRWVYDNADTLGVDRARIAVGGMSAGGGLAAALALRARDEGRIPIIFQLLLYPMLDDRTASTQPPGPFAGEFVWRPENNVFAWTALLGGPPGVDGVSAYLSPARVADVADSPPAFVGVGALDLFVEEDVSYAARLVRAGVATELHVYPGAVHAFDSIAPTSRLARALHRDALAALQRAVNA